jgi:hypothetical protein
VLTINVSYSTLTDTAFLYQGLNSDYFEVPVAISLSNTSAVNLGAFDLSMRFQAYDGIHPARFRFDDQSTYFDSQSLSGINVGQPFNREVRMMVPRIYENTDITLSVQIARCQTDIKCTTNSLSYSLPQIVYDFIDAAYTASWSASVRLDPGLRLEDGFQPEYALYTDPAWGGNNIIVGSFDLRAVPMGEGDRLFARVGYLDGAGGDGATFRILCTFGGGNLPVQVISFHKQVYNREIVRVYDRYDRIVRGLNVLLPPEVLSGACPYFYMIVEAGPTANSDWTVWLSAYIARFRANGAPPLPPTSTPQPSLTPTLTTTPPPSATPTGTPPTGAPQLLNLPPRSTI